MCALNGKTSAMITIDLSGKTILLTGALGAIAEHIVRRLVAAGATLVLVDLKPREEALQKLDGWDIPTESFVYHSVDITDTTSLCRVVDGSIDIPAWIRCWVTRAVADCIPSPLLRSPSLTAFSVSIFSRKHI